MNLHEFLTRTEIHLPMRWDAHRDFEAFVGEQLDTFLRLIDQLDPNAVSDEVQRRKPSILSCCDGLRRSLRTFFEGHPREAYQHFAAAVQDILLEINGLAFTVTGPTDFGILYRVRQIQIPALNRNDLFHIPFELRHVVATQRYSIPGLPCLYLAGSLYTCWEEMGRPPLHELQCAAFWVKPGRSLRMLNLSNRPARLAAVHAMPPGSVPSDHSFLSSHIVLWPLFFATSIFVKHRSSPFKPEYIFSQMVLQWLTQNHGVDGIAYFSTHVRAISKHHPLPICNVIVPAKNITAFGRCQWLCDTFKMTDPFGWQLLACINVGEGPGKGSIPMYDLEFIEGVEEPYRKTEFGTVQMKLNKMVSRITHRNRNGEPMLGDVAST